METSTSLDMEYPQSNNSSAIHPAFSRDFILAANMYGLPVVILLGLIGNTMSFVVFVGSQLRHQSSSVYLAFLNFADCLFLLCLLMAQLEWLHIFLMRKDGFCQLVVYFSYVSAFLSVWTVVAFTVERFIVVYFPLKRFVHCTKRRATMVVVSLLVTSLFLYNFALWTHRVQKYPWGNHNECMYLEQFTSAIQVLSMIDTIITMVVPSLIIIVLNILISVGVWRFLRQGHEDDARVDESLEGLPMTELTQTHPGEVDTQHTARRGSASYWIDSTGSAMLSLKPKQSIQTTNNGRSVQWKWHKFNTAAPLRRHTAPSQAVQLRTTSTLLVISTLFVIFNLPSHAFRVWVMVHPPEGEASESVHLWQLVFQFLYYLNFSCNLLMYCVCSKMFRAELKAMLIQGWRRCECRPTDCYKGLRTAACCNK